MVKNIIQKSFDGLSVFQKRVIMAGLLVGSGMYFVWKPDAIPDVAGVATFIDDFLIFIGVFVIINRYLLPSPKIRK